jgi:hypothetical protein
MAEHRFPNPNAASPLADIQTTNTAAGSHHHTNATSTVPQHKAFNSLRMWTILTFTLWFATEPLMHRVYWTSQQMWNNTNIAALWELSYVFSTTANVEISRVVPCSWNNSDCHEVPGGRALNTLGRGRKSLRTKRKMFTVQLSHDTVLAVQYNWHCVERHSEIHTAQ